MLMHAAHLDLAVKFEETFLSVMLLPSSAQNNSGSKCYQMSLSCYIFFVFLKRLFLYLQAGVLCIDSLTTMFLVPSCKLAINLGKPVAFNIHASANLVQ